MNIGIVGHGFVGKALDYGFKDTHNILVNDKFHKESTDLKVVLEESDVIFFCLPTPFDEETMHIDLDIYDRVIKEASELISGKLFCIKSTVVPETTKHYQELYPNNNFSFNPEFLTEANSNEDFVNSERIVLGGDEDALKTLTEVYRACPAFTNTPIVTMSATEAEMVKYMANITLATRVAVANTFYDLCQDTNCDYENVRAGIITDSRIGPSHNTVTEDRGFGGKCFPKDLAAIIGKGNDLGTDVTILQEIFDYNNRIRENQDWREIPGAVTSGKQYS
jgi:UDPglucose 6-dehydrogenase